MSSVARLDVSGRCNVLFFVPRFHTNLIGWIRALQSLGLQTCVVGFSRGPLEDYASAQPLVLQQRRMFPATWSESRARIIRGISGVGVLASWREVWQVAQRRRPNIVVVRLAYTSVVLQILIVCLVLRMRVVLYSQKPSFASDPAGMRRCATWLLRTVLSWELISPVESTVCVSPRSSHIRQVRRFLPFAVEPPLELEPIRSPLQIISVGKFRKRKGFEELLSAVAASSSFMEEGDRCVLVGECYRDDERAHLAELKDLARSLQIEHQVAFRPNLSHEEVLEEMKHSDIFVLNSTKEPASISQVEAMACGAVPIVNCDNGTAKYIDNGVTGFICKNSEELSRYLTRLLNDSSLRLHIRSQVHLKALEAYSVEAAADNWSQLFTGHRWFAPIGP